MIWKKINKTKNILHSTLKLISTINVEYKMFIGIPRWPTFVYVNFHDFYKLIHHGVKIWK